MKSRILIIIVLFIIIASSLSCSVTRVATPHRPVPMTILDVSIFYDQLSPYGRWFQINEYGWVWTPYDVPFGWRPYTHGHWAYTDYGWTWVSSWRWGWAPFHYGRWTHHRQHGWCWIPGTVWGPAWVVWRHRPGYVGWAALPPQAGWQSLAGVNLRDIDLDAVIEPDWYAFVDEENLTAENLARHIEHPTRNAGLLRDSRRITDYAQSQGRVINRGVDVEQIEKSTRKAIKRQRVIEAESAGIHKVSGDGVFVYKPKIEDRAPTRTPTTVISKPQDATQRQQEKQQRKLEQQQAEERARQETQQMEDRKRQEQQQRKLEQQQAEERAKLEKQQRKAQKQAEQQAEEQRQQQEKQKRKKKPPEPL